MHLLRSRLFLILIALLVLVGYSEVLGGSCCHESAPNAVTEAGHPADSHPDGQDCHCVCHQTFAPERFTPSGLADPTRSPELLVFTEIADIPPDAIPLGIDYPPQLA